MNMILHKDSKKMLLNATLVFTVLLASAAFAETDSLVQKQKGLIAKLQNFQEQNIGFSFEGTAKSGYRSSVVKSDSLAEESPSDETSAFSEMELILQARPSKESRARVEMRIHQDWQKAHEQGVNPILIHWWSYDGRALDRKLNFNIGDMRLKYTPLTIALPTPKLIQEPEIFRVRREEAMAYRNLDGTDRRLMQGLNADFHSGSVGPLDDIHAQGSVARLRTNPKKSDQIAFDFDREDRYLLGGRFGVGAFGASIGFNYVDASDRIKSARNIKLAENDTMWFDQNQVMSLEVGFDTKQILDPQLAKVGIHVEYATSNWSSSRDIGLYDSSATVEKIVRYYYINPQGLRDSTLYVLNRPDASVLTYEHQKLEDEKGTALLFTLNGSTSMSEFDVSLRANYMQNNEKFWSELAATPAFKGNTPILNSDAIFHAGDASPVLSMVRSGTLENMYFTMYQTLPLTARNQMAKSNIPGVVDPGQANYYDLFNNYEMAHYYRNGYNNQTFTRSEAAAFWQGMDPSANLALPFGYSTPDRSGFDADISVMFQSFVEVNLLFGQYKAKEMDNASYTRIGVGTGVDFARFLGMERAAELSGSFEKTTESKFLKRKSQRIMVGGKVGVWKGLSLLAGMQSFDKDLNYLSESTTLLLQGTTETLILGGPQIEISKGSKVSAQYGLMTNEISYVGTSGKPEKISMDKSLIMADVSVQF